MRITRTVAVAGLAGAIAIAGLGATAVAAPAVLAAAESEGTDGPLQAIRDALAGLVGDGTITQEQADAVADTLGGAGVLGHGHGGRGGRLLDLEVAAETVGLTVEQLRTQLAEDGATLAGIAEAQDVETSTLVDALVEAATERLEAAVTDGRLTRSQADERIAALPERVGAAVETELGLGGHGHRGLGPRGGDGHGGAGHGGDGHGGDGHWPRGGDDAATPTPGTSGTGTGTDA